MKSVLTLIAPPDKEKLSPDLISALEERLLAAGAQIVTTDWLAMMEACDIVYTHLDASKSEAIARELIGDSELDCVAQETDGRQKKLLIADMDSTLITVECLDEIADYAGVKEQVSAITERAMRGELEFAAALDERVALLKCLPASVLEQVWKERIVMMGGAKSLVATMRSSGAHCILVSGGFDYFTSRVAKELGFHSDNSNRLEIENGVLTGRVIPPILDRNAKLQTLMQVCMEKGISTSDALAVGDGANDIPMLVAAGIGVAYHAKPIVRQSARARIDYGDLSALLYAQGYRKEEIIG